MATSKKPVQQDSVEIPKMEELASLYKRALKAGNVQAASASQQAAAAAAAAAGKAEEARSLARFADIA